MMFLSCSPRVSIFVNGNESNSLCKLFQRRPSLLEILGNKVEIRLVEDSCNIILTESMMIQIIHVYIPRIILL